MARKMRAGRAAPGDLLPAIRAKGYEWSPGETSVSSLTATEQKSLLGLAVTDEEIEAMASLIKSATSLQALHAPAPAAPVKIDWRNNGGDWTTPIRDQKNCGSCVAFGTVAAFESRIKITCQSVSLTPDLSEAQLFYCGCGNCCGSGWNFPPALNYCQQNGLAPESAFPYTPGNQPCKQGLPAPYAKVTGWTTVLTLADRKNILATKGPVLGGMAVYQDFFAYKSGVYKQISKVLAGYHAICVVGYDDTAGCWICKNSWGPAWGENGWFRIGYGQCNIDTSFAFYDMNVTCPIPPDPCKAYVPTLVRILQAARANPALRACLRYYVCGLGPRPLCRIEHVRLVQTVLAFLKRCPRYRPIVCRSL